MEIIGKRATYTWDEQTDVIRKGKFSVVYKGYTKQGVSYAIKATPITHLTTSEAFSFPDVHPRLLISHEEVCTETHHYAFRPWVNGVDVSKYAQKISLVQACEWTIQLLDVLSALNQQQWLHLDIQPKNILITEQGEVYLIDLGLALPLGKPAEMHPFNLYYSAPEQLLQQAELFSYSTDLYAVGMVLRELVTGAKPHHHPNPEVLFNLLLAAPNSMEGVPKPFHELLLKALAKPRFLLPPPYYTTEELHTQIKASQAQRFQTADEFKAALVPIYRWALRKKKSWYQFW